MPAFEDSSSDKPRQNRWYDKDPVLHRAIEQLRESTDRQQAQIALNIIKIVIEHQMETATDIPSEHMNSVLPFQSNAEKRVKHRRWYDVDETLSSAMQLLRDCPDDLQKRLIPSICFMIENTLMASVEAH